MSNRAAQCSRARCPRARGQSLVEMALVTPVLVLLVVGVFEFGLIFYAHVQVANAVREAARAASLYRSTRYATVDQPDTTKCASPILGWSLQQATEQAIVYRALDANGCPLTGGAIVYSSLGWLDPAASTPYAWQAQIAEVDDTTFWPQTNADAMPDAGKRAKVTLTYPYRLQIVSNVLPFLTDPIVIIKSVEFEFQR